MVRHQTTLYFSSDKANGATQISADGSTFAIEMSPPLILPAQCTSIEAAVVGAQIWFNTPNIVTGKNDWLPTTATRAAAPANAILPQGLYGIEQLNEWSVNAIAATLSFSAEQATGRIRITNLTTVAIQLYFNVAGSIGPSLGFTQAIVLGARASAVGNLPAQLNTLNLYLIENSSGFISRGGLPVNGVRSGIIGTVPVTKGTQPLELIRYDPSQLQWTDCTNILAGVPISNAQFRLVDDQRKPVNTVGETYSFQVALRYTV